MFILDLETRPQDNLTELYNVNLSAPGNYKDPEKINAYLAAKRQESRKGMSLDTDYADILCVGLKKLGEPGALFEGSQLQEVLHLVGDEKLITFNGKSFDIPLLIKYGLKHGLDLPYQRLREALRKWQDAGGHYDLMEVIGQGNFRSLDEYAKIYLGRGKAELDFETASEDEIKEHCLEDLTLTEELFLKFKPLFV